jgi:nitrogen regulatory protein PII
MHPVKRIEIISDSVELEKILKVLDKEEVSSYTVIRNVVGRGVRGTVSNSFDMTSLENDYVVAFCTLEQVKPVVASIRPILNRFGGSCYISDSMEVASVQCVASR